MAITFYAGSGSPYVWRVWLTLEYKQIAYDLKMLSFSAGDTKKPEFSELNPRHRVPVIVDGHFALYESAAIVEYLEDCYPETPIFPKGIKERAIVRRTIAEADHYYAVAMERLVDQILFQSQQDWNATEIVQARDACLREIAGFENALAGPFLCGELSAADFALYPLIALTLRMERKKTDLGISQQLGPKLQNWMQRIQSLPYFEKTYPPHWKNQS